MQPERCQSGSSSVQRTRQKATRALPERQQQRPKDAAESSQSAARALPERQQQRPKDAAESNQSAARALPERCQSAARAAAAASKGRGRECTRQKKTGQKGRSKERGKAPLPYIYLLEIIVAAKTAVFARPQQEKTQFSGGRGKK